MPASSASPELSAIVFCVEDQCLTVCSPPHADPSARGASGAQTPREVRIDEHADHSPLVLPEETVNGPGPHGEIPSKPQAGRPISR
eukprot:2972817-Alexandrium_andersonii.AAC.1